jgi:hypothetical protein
VAISGEHKCGPRLRDVEFRLGRGGIQPLACVKEKSQRKIRSQHLQECLGEEMAFSPPIGASCAAVPFPRENSSLS